MRVFLANPSHVSFGTAVIIPRWLYVLAAATPPRWNTPSCATKRWIPSISPVGAGDVMHRHHTGHALRGV